MSLTIISDLFDGNFPLDRSMTFSCFNTLFRVVSVLGCMKSLIPYHIVVANARLKSIIAVDSSGWSWLSQGEYPRTSMNLGSSLTEALKLVLLIDNHSLLHSTRSRSSKSISDYDNPGSAFLYVIDFAPSPGLSSLMQSLPLGHLALIGGEGWTSALANVPPMVPNNTMGASSVQQTVLPNNTNDAPPILFNLCGHFQRFKS
ncbi:LOW QUALITY PROTEIN: hypothetical protein RJ641_017915 [Dillenia turbinata]|uniref:Uncharacterized protein n=1 Tax=Dillenia turbinata TaxID=194707 RepID=A0AAN8UQI2_9MAGN